LQRNPYSSLEQLGQIDDASILEVAAGLRSAGVPIAVSTAMGVVTGRDEFPAECAFELIPVL
jgi:hypothetical protein